MMVRRVGDAVTIDLLGKTIVYGPTAEIVQLSPSAAAVWACLQSAVDLDELIADVLAVIDGVGTDAVARDVRVLVEELVDIGLVESVPVRNRPS